MHENGRDFWVAGRNVLWNFLRELEHASGNQWAIGTQHTEEPPKHECCLSWPLLPSLNVDQVSVSAGTRVTLQCQLLWDLNTCLLASKNKRKTKTLLGEWGRQDTKYIHGENREDTVGFRQPMSLMVRCCERSNLCKILLSYWNLIRMV